jgi:four helix bundle protein
MTDKDKITSFTDLIVWQKSHTFVLEIYKVTKTFPKEEVFCLTSQMRQVAVSVTSNIAESFSRKSSKEKSQFYMHSRGSLVELQNQLLICRDIGLISNSIFLEVSQLSIEVHKLLNAFITRTRGL